MNKRIAGVMFCLIAGGLFAIRYIVAALFMSGVSSWNAMNFAAGLEYQGNGLLIFQYHQSGGWHCLSCTGRNRR